MSETVDNNVNKAQELWKQYGVEKDEDKPKASNFASEDSIFTESDYDRTKSGREAIINYQTKPDDKDSKATYLDIDKYYDEYHVTNKDTYFEDVSLQYMTDIAAYFNIDLNDEKGLEKLADVYEQIADKNKLTTKRASYDNVEDYIVACNNEIAKRSWNGTLDDDFIDLSDIKVKEDEPDLPEGWTLDDDGTITTGDGKTVEAINQEDLEKNDYVVSEDEEKILDADGNEVGIVVTTKKDTDGDGVVDDVKSYFKYVEKKKEKTEIPESVKNIIDNGIAWVNSIIENLKNFV